MGVVRIVVDANWNTGCSDKRVSLDSVRVGNRSRGRFRPGFSACSLPAIQTILSRQRCRQGKHQCKKRLPR